VGVVVVVELSSRRAGVVVAALAVLLALLTAPAARGVPAAQAAADPDGYDISWPQCPTSAGGFGLPLPPASAGFVVIGLTKGLPFTENPCLASQVSWSRTNNVAAQAYTIPAFPTAAQLTSYRAAGPWSSSTRTGQLSNVGYAQARYAVAALQRTGLAPGTVWIDVEPRPAQPWPTGTAARQRENRAVVEGLMRGLRDAGLSYGLYTYSSAWADITGSWYLPGIAGWYPVGTLDTANEASARCGTRSPSGGPIRMVQWVQTVTGGQQDADLLCPGYPFATLAMPASTLSNSTADFNGDWKNDLLARVAATGDLRLYRGTGTGALAAGVTVGTGWQRLDGLETPGDLTGDGALDVLAREPATGYLWLYPGNGRGGWLPRIRAGTGWNVMNALVGPGDFTGDQRPDLLARERSTGNLWLYPGNGRGGWLPRVRVGTGWNAFDAVVGPGDVNGDGTADVLARDPRTGYLWLYPGNGRSGWLPRVLVGTGWNVMSAVVGAGDLNGDRLVDVVARERSTGYLWLYPRTATGWLPRVRIGTGWNGINAIF